MQPTDETYLVSFANRSVNANFDTGRGVVFNKIKLAYKATTSITALIRGANEGKCGWTPTEAGPTREFSLKARNLPIFFGCAENITAASQ